MEKEKVGLLKTDFQWELINQMFKQAEKIILASSSSGRKRVLNFGNIEFEVAKDLVNDEQEDSFKLTVEHLSNNEVIQKISDFKGLEISKNYPDHYVLSSDQGCIVDGNIISKPKKTEDAINQITKKSGKYIQLITVATLCKNGNVVWQHTETPEICMRKYSKQDAIDYVNAEAESETGSVIGIGGAVKTEGPLGVHMIKSTQGSHFTIIGLPLNALIDELYRLKILT